MDPAVLAAATAWSDRGVPLALVSNQEPRRARYLEERLAPLLAVGGTAFSGDIGAVKSDPDFYGRAERHLGLAGRRAGRLSRRHEGQRRGGGRHGWTGIHFTRTGTGATRSTKHSKLHGAAPGGLSLPDAADQALSSSRPALTFVAATRWPDGQDVGHDDHPDGQHGDEPDRDHGQRHDTQVAGEESQIARPATSPSGTPMMMPTSARVVACQLTAQMT